MNGQIQPHTIASGLSYLHQLLANTISANHTFLQAFLR